MLFHRFEEELHERHEAEMKRLRDEEEKVLASEREVQEARMNQKKASDRCRGTHVRVARESSLRYYFLCPPTVCISITYSRVWINRVRLPILREVS